VTEIYLSVTESAPNPSVELYAIFYLLITFLGDTVASVVLTLTYIWYQNQEVLAPHLRNNAKAHFEYNI
jgi:hypothetical protein